MHLGARLANGTIRLVAVLAIVWMVSTSASRVQAQTPGSVSTGTIAAAQGELRLDTSNAGAAAVQLTGTWAGTIAFEGSVDGGTFVSLNMVPSNSATAATSATATGAWSANIGGYRQVRARASAWTSGTATVTLSSAGSGGK